MSRTYTAPDGTTRRKPLNARQRALMIAKRNRLIQTEDLLLAGVTSPRKIAAEIGCGVSTARDYIRTIELRWKKDDPKNSARKRQKRVRQLEKLMSTAIDSFKESQGETIVRTVAEKTEKCRACKGRGEKEEDGLMYTCDLCEGEGSVSHTEETQRIEQNAGDATYLRLAKECIGEINRLEGTTIQRVEKKTTETKELKATVVQERRLTNVPADDIIEAMTAVRKLTEVPREDQTAEMVTVEGAVAPAEG